MAESRDGELDHSAPTDPYAREAQTFPVLTPEQAGRVADYTAFFMLVEPGIGGLVEYGKTEQIFTAPRDKRTEEYVTGRFGSEATSAIVRVPVAMTKTRSKILVARSAIRARLGAT